MTALCNTCTTFCSGFSSSNTPRQFFCNEAAKVVRAGRSYGDEHKVLGTTVRLLHTVASFILRLHSGQTGSTYTCVKGWTYLLKALCLNRQRQENGPSGRPSADLYRSRRWPQSPLSSATPDCPTSPSNSQHYIIRKQWFYHWELIKYQNIVVGWQHFNSTAPTKRTNKREKLVSSAMTLLSNSTKVQFDGSAWRSKDIFGCGKPACNIKWF